MERALHVRAAKPVVPSGPSAAACQDWTDALTYEVGRSESQVLRRVSCGCVVLAPVWFDSTSRSSAGVHSYEPVGRKTSLRTPRLPACPVWALSGLAKSLKKRHSWRT